MSTIDLQQPTSAFTGAHIQNTTTDVSLPIATVVNPQPSGGPTATGIFDALKDVTTRNMIFRLENKNADGDAFLTAPEFRSYAGTYAQFTQDGFEIRQDNLGKWGIYHRKSDGQDAAGNAPSGYVYKNVVYGFDLEHKFAGFQSMVQAARLAKLTSTDFLKAADLNHTVNQEHKKVSPMTEANAFAAHEIYECTSDNGAKVEQNMIRVVPGSESSQKQLTHAGVNLSGVILPASLGPFADAVKTKLDANKSTIEFDTLVQRTKNIQSIAANTTSTTTQEIKIQHDTKFPKSNQDITGAVFNATPATMPLTIGAATLPSNNGLAPSQALAFKASIGTAAQARVETVTIEDKEYGSLAVRNTQLLTLNQAKFAAQTTSEAMPETTLTVAPADATPKTVTVKVGGNAVVDQSTNQAIQEKTYNVSTAASGSLTFQNAANWGGLAVGVAGVVRATRAVVLYNGDNSGSTTNEVYLTTAAGVVHTISSTGTKRNGQIPPRLKTSFEAITALSGFSFAHDEVTAWGPGNYRFTITGPANGENFGLRGNSAIVSRNGTQSGALTTSNVNTTNGVSVASNSDLTITVNGSEATFAIGSVAGGSSTLSALATAVAAHASFNTGTMSAVKVGDDTVTFTKTDGNFAILSNNIDEAVSATPGNYAPGDSTNYVAAGDYSSAAVLAKAIQSGINAMNDIHADLDPDGSGNNTIINIRGTRKTNENGLQKMDFTQTIPIQITQTPTTATGLCDAFDNTEGAGAFPSGMTHTVFGSDLSTGSGFEYSVRVGTSGTGKTVTVAAGKADVDAVLNDIHTGFNNAANFSRTEKVLLEGKFDGPANLTKKIRLADSLGNISGGSAGENLRLFDFQPVLGNKATASGDFTTAANAVSAPFKAKVKLGGFVALCAADDTVLSYLEVIPGYVIEGSGSNSAKLESYDTSANPFLTKINGASAEVTVNSVSAALVFNTNKTVLFHADDTTSIGASRIGSDLIKANVIAAFEKGSKNGSGFTQAYTGSTIRVYYADGTANASLAHNVASGSLTFRNAANWLNQDLSITVDGQEATFYIGSGAQYNTLAALAHAVAGHASFNAGTLSAVSDGTDTVTFTKTGGNFAISSNNIFNAVSANAGNYASASSVTPISALQFAERGVDTLTIRSSHDSDNSSVSVTVGGVDGGGDATNAATAAAKFVDGFTAAKKTAGKIASVSANNNVLTFTGLSEGPDAVTFTLKKADNSALDANNPLATVNTTPYANGTHETVTFKYGTGENAPEWGPMTIGKAPRNGVAGAADHFLTSQAAADNFYAWANTGGAGDLIANVDKITGVAQDGLTVTVSGEKVSGAAPNTKSFQFTKTGDGSNNVTAATTAEIIGTEATNDIIYTITATDENGGNSTSTIPPIRCGHSTNITKKTVEGVDSLLCNTLDNIRDYIADAVCDLGAMIDSKATNGANVTLNGRANGKAFAVTITAADKDGNAVDIKPVNVTITKAGGLPIVPGGITIAAGATVTKESFQTIVLDGSGTAPAQNEVWRQEIAGGSTAVGTVISVTGNNISMKLQGIKEFQATGNGQTRTFTAANGVAGNADQKQLDVGLGAGQSAVYPGMGVAGTGIAPNTRIAGVAVDGTITLSDNLTLQAAGDYIFTKAFFKNDYSATRAVASIEAATAETVGTLVNDMTYAQRGTTSFQINTNGGTLTGDDDLVIRSILNGTVLGSVTLTDGEYTIDIPAGNHLDVGDLTVGTDIGKITYTTASEHGIFTGDSVTLKGNTANAANNGTFPATRVDGVDNKFSVVLTEILSTAERTDAKVDNNATRNVKLQFKKGNDTGTEQIIALTGTATNVRDAIVAALHAEGVNESSSAVIASSAGFYTSINGSNSTSEPTFIPAGFIIANETTAQGSTEGILRYDLDLSSGGPSSYEVLYRTSGTHTDGVPKESSGKRHWEPRLFHTDKPFKVLYPPLDPTDDNNTISDSLYYGPGENDMYQYLQNNESEITYPNGALTEPADRSIYDTTTTGNGTGLKLGFAIVPDGSGGFKVDITGNGQIRAERPGSGYLVNDTIIVTLTGNDAGKTIQFDLKSEFMGRSNRQVCNIFTGNTSSMSAAGQSEDLTITNYNIYGNDGQTTQSYTDMPPGYVSAVAAKANSDDTLVLTSTKPTSYSDDQTFIIKVTDDTNVDAIVQDGDANGEISVSALGTNLFNTTVIDVGAAHGILANDVVTVAGTTNNNLATKVVVAVNGSTISLAETGTEQQAPGGTVKVHNILDMTMANQLNLSIMDGASSKLGPVNTVATTNTAADFAPAATMKDVMQEFWTYTKANHGLSTNDIVQQVSEAGFEVEIARGTFIKTGNNSGEIRQVKGRFQADNAFKLRQSADGTTFSDLSTTPATELVLTSTAITNATKEMFLDLEGGIQMNTQGKFEVGKYYVLNTAPQTIKAVISGANADKFGLNATALGLEKEYDLKLEAGALSVLSGPNAVADTLRSGKVEFTTASGLYEGDFGDGTSEVIQFVLSHTAATGASNDANWGYYSDGTPFGQVGTDIRSGWNYNSALSSPGNFTWDNTTKVFTGTGQFCTCIFELNQNAKTIINYTKIDTHGAGAYIGVQNAPTITNANLHGGTGVNGNGGAALMNGIPGQGTYWFTVDIPNRKLYHNGTEMPFDAVIGQNGQTVYLALYDGNSFSTGSVTINQVYEVVTTQTKTLAGTTQLNTGTPTDTNDYTITSQIGNNLSGSGTFASGALTVTMKNSNNDDIEFGTATFAQSSTTGKIDMTLNLDKNTFLLDNNMEFIFTLKLAATGVPAGIPAEDATAFVLYKFTNFQKPYALHSNQDLANRATWRTLSDTANASIADFSMIGETLKAVNDNFYVTSRTQAQLLDIDGLTWAYDNTAAAEKYTATISLSDAKSVQISNYGRLGADIHADLKALKAGAGNSFSVPVQVDFLNKAVKGGFTKKNGDDQTLHYSDLSFTDEVRDPDSVKIHTLDVAYTADTSVVLTIKCDDVDQKALNQISDAYPANQSTNRKAPFGASSVSGKITQLVSMDGVAIAAGNLANAANLPMTSGNFQLQTDSAASVVLLGNSTDDDITGKKKLTVTGDIVLSNALTFAAGTRIVFQNNASSLKGRITCTGTATDPVVFQSASDSIDDVGKGSAGREGNWKHVELLANSDCAGCVFLGGGQGVDGTVILNGDVTMSNCAIFNSKSKSISVASGSSTLDFITVGNNATAPDGSPTNLITLTNGEMVQSGSGTDTFAAANREWFAVQNRVDMHLSYAVPTPYNLTKNADQGAGAFIFYRSSLAGGINVFRMNSSSKSSVARGVSLYNPALVTLDPYDDDGNLSFARRTPFNQTIGTLKLNGAALSLKHGSIPAGIYVYLDKENTQGSLKRNLDTGVIELTRSATEIPSQVKVRVSNSNRGIFDVDSKDDLAPINLTYTEDPNLEVKHHEKVVNPFRKVIEGGDYTDAIDVAGMTQVIIDGPVVLKGAGASLAFDANTDVVMIERDRTPTTGVLSMANDELLASIDDNTGFAVGTYYADLTGGDGTGGKVKIVVGAGEVGAITSLDVTHQGSGFAAGNTLTVGTATRDEDDNNDLGKDLTITLAASDVADVYPFDMSGIIENGGQVSFGAGCVVRTNTDYQLSKANNAKVLGMVCGSTTNPTKRFYINRELVSLAVEAPTGNAADMFFVPCRMGSCDDATLSQPLSHANRLTDAIRLPATVNNYSCTDVALVDQALTISGELRVEPGARLVGHKSIAEKIAQSATMGAKTVTVATSGTLQCLGFDSTNAAELHGLNVTGPGRIQLRHALVTLVGDTDKIDFNTIYTTSFIDRVEIKATASGSRAAGLIFGANLDGLASVLEARQIKMDGAPIQVETNNLLLQDCDVLNIHSSKYAINVTTYGSTIRKIRVNAEQLVEGATGTKLNDVQNGTFMKDVEQGIVGASEGAFENDLVIHNVAAAAFNTRARLYAEKEANDRSIALTKSLTAADGFVDARADAALAAYNNERAGFGGAAIADRAAFRAAIAMEGAADYFMHVGQTFDKDVDQEVTGRTSTTMTEQFFGHMILNGELLDRVKVKMTVTSGVPGTPNIFDDDSLTRTIVATTEKCKFEGSIATTAFTFTQKPILLVNGGLRDPQGGQILSDPSAATNAAVEKDAFNTYAALGNQTMNYASVAATGDLGTPAKKRVLVSQADLLTVTINAALDGTSTYKYDPYIIQSEYGRLDKGAYNVARSAGDLTYVGIFGSTGDVALTANDNHVAILHTLGNAASGTLKNTYIEDCTGHAIAGDGVLNTRLECVDYGDRLCNGDITQGGAVLYAESEKAPRGSEATQFGSTNSVTGIQAPHQAFFTLPNVGSSFGALSDANRLAHWWNPLKTFTVAYPFQDLANNSSQAIVYGYLQADGAPAILNGGEAARLSATRIGATKFYELKKAAATAGAPKVHYKTAGSNAVEVSMASEVTMAAAAAGTPTTQNSSDANATTKRTDRTANGDTIALQAAQLTLDDAALWGAKKQVVTATPPSGSYNELLLPANDAVRGSVQFASQKSIPTGTYVFKRIEYVAAKDVQYGGQGSMNPSPRGFTVSDTQTLTVTVQPQPKLQLFAKDAGPEAQLDADRTRILRASQLDAGAGGDIKAIVRVNIVNAIPNIVVSDHTGNTKFQVSNEKVVSVAGQHGDKDTTGQTLVLKLNETAGAYNGATNGLTVQNVMQGEVADSEFGTQSVTIKSVKDIDTVDIDGTYFDTTNANTHLVCRNKWYDLAIAPSPNVRSIAVNVNSGGTRPLAGDERCTITATETLGNSDALTDFIGDWTWTPANDDKTDTLTGTLSLPAQSQTFGSGANTTLNGDQTFNKPVVIIEGEVTITNGNVIVGANVNQILFKDNANLIITGDLTIDRNDLSKPVLARHIDDHTLQFCQGEFKGIDVAGNGNIKGLMIVGGTDQLKVGSGTLGGDTAAKGIRLINGSGKALQITGDLSGHCQNVYIRGAKVGLEVSGTTAVTHLKDIRIDDCLNNALTLNSAVSIGDIFVNSPSEPRDTGMSKLMGNGAVTLLGSTTQYMAADTRNQGSLAGIASWTTSAGDSEGTGLFLLREGTGGPIFTNVTFDFTSIGLSAGDSFNVSSGGTMVGTFTVSSLSDGYIVPTETTGLVDQQQYVLSVGNPVASGLVNSASTPVVNYNQGTAVDRMATLKTMGYVPAKDISTTAQVQYKEEYSHYYTDANMTASERTSTDNTNSYKIQTKEYMQGLRFSANQYTARNVGGSAVMQVSVSGTKVLKDATLTWAPNALTALQLFTGTSSRPTGAKTSIAKATSSSITMPTIADNVNEYDLETLPVAAKYDFARLKINATPANPSAKETKSDSYSMFSTLAVYGDTPQFRILAKDSGAETTYTGSGSDAHTWLFSGSTVSGAGICSPKVMLTFGSDVAATVKYDMLVVQGTANGRVYGIDGAKLLLGEVSGTFDTGSAVTINSTIDGGTPSSVVNDNRLATSNSPSMTLNHNGNLTTSNVSDPKVLGYTMQNEAYLSVFDAHPFGISGKRHADYAFGSTDAHIFGSASAYLEKTTPSFTNDGEIAVSQKATITLPADKTTSLIDVNYTMPDAITLGTTDIPLGRYNETGLRYVRGCIRPDLHPEYTAPQAGATIDSRNYSYAFSGTQKVGNSDDNIATLNASPSIPASAGLAGTSDQQQFIDHIQVFGAAPANTYKGETSGLKDGFLLEFDRGLLTGLKEHLDATVTFAKTGNDITVSGIAAHGFVVNDFVNIVAVTSNAANAGLFQITARSADTFTFVNANGVAETNRVATFEQHADIGLKLGDDNSPNTTLATRNLVTTLAVRPGLQYKAAFGDSGAEGVFTFNCQYFPRIVLDPASSTLAGKFSMVDGLGFQCQTEPTSFQPLCTSLANHASYTGPFGGMGVVESYTIQDFSDTMEQSPKLFKIPDQQQDGTTANGTTGTLEIQDPATWPNNNGIPSGIKAKVRTDFCIYVQDSQNTVSLRPVNAPHTDNTNSGILVTSANVELCRVGDTITDGTNSGIIEKIVVQTVGTRTIQLKMTASSTIGSSTNSSASNNTASTLSVNNNTIFTVQNGNGISWISAVTYYANTTSPITQNTYVMFAAADNTKGQYGLLRCTAYDTSNGTVTLTSEDSGNETLPQADDLPHGTTVMFLETGSTNATLSDQPGVATFKSGHKKVTLTLNAAGSYTKGDAVSQASTTATGTVWKTYNNSTEVEVLVSSGTFVTGAATIKGADVTISEVGASTDMFKATHGGGEVASKLVMMGLATHGIRTNSNGVYENKGQKYMLHMRMDNKEVQVEGTFQQSFINKVLVIDTALENPYTLMRTTTVGNNDNNPQMSNVIRGTQKTPTSLTMGSDTTVFTSHAYETKELNVVNVDMDAGATVANNPSHWAGNMTREKDLSGILIVNPNDLTEHGSTFVQNTHHIKGTLQFLKRPTLDTVSVTGSGTDVVFNFTNRLALPADAKIVVTFPASFTLGDVTGASSPDSSIGGSFAGVQAGQVVTITRSGGNVVAAKTACQISVPNVTNMVNGTDGFEIYLTDADDNVLETDYKTQTIAIS